VGGLLEGRRHQVVRGLPFIAVVCNLPHPLVDRRLLAVLAGPRDLVDDDGCGDGADGDVKPPLFQMLAPCPVTIPMQAGSANGSSPCPLRTYSERLLDGVGGLVAVARSVGPSVGGARRPRCPGLPGKLCCPLSECRHGGGRRWRNRGRLTEEGR
jgi:hypothetical protein